MGRIIKLHLINGETLCAWVSSKTSWDASQNIWADARREIADHYDCALSRVGTIENDCGGEFITVDDEPVAFMVTTTSKEAPSLDTLTVDLRPMLIAAE